MYLVPRKQTLNQISMQKKSFIGRPPEVNIFGREERKKQDGKDAKRGQEEGRIGQSGKCVSMLPPVGLGQAHSRAGAGDASSWLLVLHGSLWLTVIAFKLV